MHVQLGISLVRQVLTCMLMVLLSLVQYQYCSNFVSYFQMFKYLCHI